MQGGSAAMSSSEAQQRYIELLQAGPFAGVADPWAEDGHYFHQIHAGMIGDIMARLQAPLLARGYYASREASLQISERVQPDIGVLLRTPNKSLPHLDYDTVATQLLVSPGITLEDSDAPLDALYIYQRGTSELVTILEVVSPSNKATRSEILLYRQRSELFIYGRSVNVVEIDATRSIMHLVSDRVAGRYPYHIAVHLPEGTARLLGTNWDHPLERFALPLRGDGIVVDVQSAYDSGYRAASIGTQILDRNDYSADTLPFPSTLTDAQRDEALMRVESWKSQLEQLRAETGS
jgi:hypothetical protein